MHAMNHSRCYMHARPSCHVCIDFIKYHSQYNGVKEQCGPLFLSERKNELSIPGELLLGWVGSSWAHTPPACPASSRGQHCTAAPPRTSGAVCSGDFPPTRILRWLVWSGLSLLSCDRNGPLFLP